MRVKKFYEPVLFASVLFIGECSPQELDEYLKSKKMPLMEAGKMMGATATYYKGLPNGGEQTIYLLWMESANVSTLIHECLHLVKRILTDRGIPYNETNDELMAYYQDYWFGTIWKYLKKENKVKQVIKSE